MSPTWKETQIARRMLRRRMPMDVIVRALANKYVPAAITDAVIAQRAKQKQNARDLKQKAGTLPASQIEPRSDVFIPPFVIAERDHRRALSHRSVTAFRMGDPLPGYSAAETASIVPTEPRRDPLDALVYRRAKVGARGGLSE